MEDRYVSNYKYYGGKSYRVEGALLINKILPEYDYDARIYIGSNSFRLDDYKLKRDDRLMVRNAGFGPSGRNADRIVKDTKEIMAFMKRQEKDGHKEFIVQRYPNEDRIEFAISASFVFEKQKPVKVHVEIKRMPREFLMLNMNTDTRGVGSRDFEPEFECELSQDDKFKTQVPKKYKKPMEELSKIFRRMYWNFIHNYKRDVKNPGFLGVILKDGTVFPVDMKRKIYK